MAVERLYSNPLNGNKSQGTKAEVVSPPSLRSAKIATAQIIELMPKTITATLLRSSGIKPYMDGDTLVFVCRYPYHAEKIKGDDVNILRVAKTLDATIKQVDAVSDMRYFEAEIKADAEKAEQQKREQAQKDLDDFNDRLVSSEKTVRMDWAFNANITHRGQGLTFDNFDKNLQSLAYKRCLEFSELKHSETATALVLCSNVYGCGKTHLLHAIANKIISTRDAIVSNIQTYSIRYKSLPVYYITEPDLMTKIRSTYNSNSTETEQSVFELLNSFPLLIIDDVGKIQPKDISFVQQVYYRLVEYRYSELKSIAIATNLEDKALDDFIGGAVVSRLTEMTSGRYFIPMKGQDYRLAKAKEAK